MRILWCRTWFLVFPSSRQDHALDQRIRDIGRMAENGRPHVLGHQLGLLADQAVRQWP